MCTNVRLAPIPVTLAGVPLAEGYVFVPPPPGVAIGFAICSFNGSWSPTFAVTLCASCGVSDSLSPPPPTFPSFRLWCRLVLTPHHNTMHSGAPMPGNTFYTVNVDSAIGVAANDLLEAVISEMTSIASAGSTG